MIPKEKATKETILVAENNVEIRYFIELKSGEKINLPEYTESYGETRLTEQKEAIQKEIDALTKKDAEKEKQEQLTKAQEKLSELEEVETKLKEIK